VHTVNSHVSSFEFCLDGDVCEARQRYAFGQLRQELRRVASGDVDANTFELLLKFSVPRTNIMYTGDVRCMSTGGHQAFATNLQLDVIRSQPEPRRVQAVCVLSHLPAHVPGPKVVGGLGRAAESYLKSFSSLHSASNYPFSAHPRVRAWPLQL